MGTPHRGHEELRGHREQSDISQYDRPENTPQRPHRERGTASVTATDLHGGKHFLKQNKNPLDMETPALTIFPGDQIKLERQETPKLLD